MTQVLGLLRLPAEIRRRVLAMPDGVGQAGLSEHTLRRIVRTHALEERVDAAGTIFDSRAVPSRGSQDVDAAPATRGRALPAA